jgi:hypothetical protein
MRVQLVDGLIPEHLPQFQEAGAIIGEEELEEMPLRGLLALGADELDELHLEG